MNATAAKEMTMTTPFHVYAIDGFESAHRSEAAAIKAAKRGAKNRKVEYRVIKCGPSGFTGAGQGTTVAVFGRNVRDYEAT